MKSRKMIVVCVIIVLISSTCCVFGENDDLRKGQITVSLQDMQSGIDIAGVSLDLYQVSCLKQSKEIIVNQFENAGIKVSNMSGEENARELMLFAEKNSINHKTKITDKNGRVSFENLEKGTYLIVQQDNSQGYYPIAPFFVKIPQKNIDGSVSYNVSANPKYEKAKSETMTYTVHKKWMGDDNVKRPQEIIVELWRGNTKYDTKRLSENNNWKYEWDNLPISSRWIIKEVNVPEKYKVEYQLNLDSAIIINQYEKAMLPQAGTKMIIIVAIFFGGIVSFVLGYLFNHNDICRNSTD